MSADKQLESGDFILDILAGVVTEEIAARVVSRYVDLRDQLRRDAEAEAASVAAIRAEGKALAQELWERGERVRSVVVAGKQLKVVTRKTYDAEEATYLLADAGLMGEALSSGAVVTTISVNQRKLTPPLERACRDACKEYVWSVSMQDGEGEE